jgi:CubicO group peptidase (beta-lactamase class C family)
MPDVDFAALADGAASRSIDRRTLLVGVAGALAAAGLSGPAHAAGSAATVAARSGRRFDPDLARRLQRVLRDALRDPSITAPGAILHVRSPRLGAWTGVAGRGRVAPDVPMRPGDRFRAGSIAKPFVAVVVLQLAERGRLSLDARLPDVLPASVVGRFPTAADITVRMLLNHRSGIPEWNSPAVAEKVARKPAKVWRSRSFSISRPRSRRCSLPGRGVRSPRSARTPGCHAVRGRGRGAGSRACCSRRRRLPHRSPHTPGGPAARGRACRVATCPR